MKRIKGEFVNLDGKVFYKIQNYNEMEPFLMMLSTSSDIWVHLSSNGCVCAGRESAHKSLFPYISEDKMFHSSDTGAKTLVKLRVSGENYLWQPFSNTYIESYAIIRNVYKSILGNCVIFEEINTDLGVCFRYRWESCEKYGIVRTACIENLNNEDFEADILDGIFNILPFTFCQTPIIYVKNGGNSIIVEFKDGAKKELSGHTLTERLSKSIFSRENKISKITVNMK